MSWDLAFQPSRISAHSGDSIDSPMCPDVVEVRDFIGPAIEVLEHAALRPLVQGVALSSEDGGLIV